MYARESSAATLPVTHAQMHDVESWHDLICSTFSRTEYKPGKETDFRGDLKAITFGETRMARIQSSGGWFGRSPSAIRGDGFDGFMILMAQNGELRLSQGENRYLAHHGEALIYRHGTPFELAIPSQYLASSLWVSPALMQRQCPSLMTRNAPLLLRRDTANGALALSMIETLCDGAVTRQMREADRLVAATLDVVSTTVTQESAGGDAMLRSRLERYALANIDDAELNLDRLARAVGASKRTLNRALGRDGTTPMRWLRDLRLEVAHDALLRKRVRNVTEAAFAHGFKDVAHFSRCFSSRYGFAPSQLLRSS